MQLKERFLNAVISSDIGKADEHGVIVELKELRQYFTDIKTDYINSFLPAAVIETGQYHATHTKFIYRVKKGVYRVHPDTINEHMESHKPVSPLNKELELILSREIIPNISSIHFRD